MNEKTTVDRIRDWQALSDEIAVRLELEGPLLVEKLCEKMSLRKLAQAAECSPTYLSLVRKGHVLISLNTYLKLDSLLEK